MSIVHRVCSHLVCPKGHTIVLPRQTPSRIFLSQPNPSAGNLKATFLCIECGALFECSPQDFRTHPIEWQDRDSPIPFLWHIASECALGNCEKLKTIFFGYAASGKEGVVEAPRARTRRGKNGMHRRWTSTMGDGRHGGDTDCPSRRLASFISHYTATKAVGLWIPIR
jgi:hypothetical protein